MKTYRLFLLPLSALLLAILAGCAGMNVLGSSEVTVTDDNNGKAIELKSGQYLNISLRGNITTGYNWEVSEPLAFMQLEGEPQQKSDSNLPGSGGVITLRMKATGTGQGKLTLIYHRPWEKDVAPLATYSLQVTVK